MSHDGKRYQASTQKFDHSKTYGLGEALRILQSFPPAGFDQSVELCVQLGIDPKHADQNLRGSVSLPHGTGKTKRVVAFCPPEQEQEAKEAGAVEAGGDELVKKIEQGWMGFDVAIATPEMMRSIARLGRMLGPRGLMPSPKAGTVTREVGPAVRDYAAGKMEFRNDAGGNVHVPVGRISFAAEQLEENARHFLKVLEQMKPSSSKGKYVRAISVSGTMTPGLHVAA